VRVDDEGKERTMNNVVGKFVLEEETVFQNTYECAAWYQAVKVQPCEVPLSWPENGHSVYAGLDGVIVGSDFTSHFGGVPYGSKHNEDVGQPGHHVVSTYTYNAEESERFVLDQVDLTVTDRTGVWWEQIAQMVNERAGVKHVGRCPHLYYWHNPYNALTDRAFGVRWGEPRSGCSELRAIFPEPIMELLSGKRDHCRVSIIQAVKLLKWSERIVGWMAEGEDRLNLSITPIAFSEHHVLRPCKRIWSNDECRYQIA
jgi:hypothetical protein